MRKREFYILHKIIHAQIIVSLTNICLKKTMKGKVKSILKRKSDGGEGQKEYGKYRWKESEREKQRVNERKWKETRQPADKWSGEEMREKGDWTYGEGTKEEGKGVWQPWQNKEGEQITIPASLFVHIIKKGLEYAREWGSGVIFCHTIIVMDICGQQGGGEYRKKCFRRFM